MRLVIEVEYDTDTWPEDAERGAELEIRMQEVIAAALAHYEVEQTDDVDIRHVWSRS